MTLAKDHFADIAEELAATYAPALASSYRPRFNVAPTDLHVVLRGDAPGGSDDRGRHLEPARWGFAAAPGRAPLFNARSETAAVLGSFRDAFLTGRCVVPADGFYEWAGPPEDRRPHWLHRRDGRLLLFAGLHQADGTGAGTGDGGAARFTVLTTRANATVARLHDRMPVILSPDDVEAWLKAGDRRLLRPAPEEDLTLTEVSKRVNSVKHDDPGCLVPVSSAEAARGQMRLF